MKTQEIIHRLKEKGFRITRARKAIVSVFVNVSDPISVLEIQKQLNKRKMLINKSTIYREVQFLLRAKIIHEIKLTNREMNYELNGRDHHHHLVCENCGTIEDVSISNEKKIMESLQGKIAFHIKTHSLEFYGLCHNCQ